MGIKEYSVLQTFVSGERDECLYYFTKGAVYLKKHSIQFSYLSSVDSNTYFNTLPVAKLKKYTDIDSLLLRVSGNGKFLVSINTSNKVGSVINKFKIELLLSGEHILEPSKECGNIFDENLLSISIQCLSDKGYIEKIEWITENKPLREVKLAAVITHFKREEAVSRVLKRISPDLSKFDIGVIVVDNSQSLNLPDYPSVSIVKNNNLGGAGGFTRGMLLAKELGYTHVILMDDDASCEVESILRTKMLFQFTCQDKLAISGALLDEEYSYSVWENGANYGNDTKPAMHQLDLRNPRNISLITNCRDSINYGAWWFFGFKLSDIKYYAFPFFVRGDDIMFSVVNKFKIITYAGVCSWGESFSNKISPTTYYLDVRHHIVQLLTRLDSNRRGINALLIKQVLICLLSYKYSSARAIILAMQHIQNGKSFWLKNIDMHDVRNEISLINDKEVFSKECIDNHRELFENVDFEPLAVELVSHEPIYRKFLRIITINGNLLPNILLQENTSYQRNGTGIWLNLKYSFMRKKICYVNQDGYYYTVAKNNSKAIKILATFVIELLKINLNYESLRKEYAEAFNSFTTEEFWKEVLGIKK